MKKYNLIFEVIVILLLVGLGLWVWKLNQNVLSLHRKPDSHKLSPSEKTPTGLKPLTEEVIGQKKLLSTLERELYKIMQDINRLEVEDEDLRAFLEDMKEAVLEIKAKGKEKSGDERPSKIPSEKPGIFAENPDLEKAIKQKVKEALIALREEEYKKREERWKERREERFNRMLGRTAEELGLDDYQKNELSKILKEDFAKRRELYSKYRKEEIDKIQRDQELKNLQQEIDSKLQNIFDSEQYNKYKEMEKERREFRGPRGP